MLKQIQLEALASDGFDRGSVGKNEEYVITLSLEKRPYRSNCQSSRLLLIKSVFHAVIESSRFVRWRMFSCHPIRQLLAFLGVKSFDPGSQGSPLEMAWNLETKLD